MYLNRIIAILKHLFGRGYKPALCPIRVRRYARCLLFVAATLYAQISAASVLVTGDVTPSDNPFTLTIDEGLPKDGNKPDPFATPSPPEENQTFFEGIRDDVNDTNININITVGKTSTGILQISQVELRDMDLIIGDSGMVTGLAETQYGTGTVFITGFGSLYNNNPYLLPAGLPANFKSKNPRLNEPGAADGFDLYVGKAGTGTLEINAFGRAEIEDSVVVGDAGGSVGNLIVDGFNSSLTSGGFEGTNNMAGNSADPHLMIIGRQGIGYMTVSSGATVDSEAPPAGNGQNQASPVGASIGSTPYSFTNGATPDQGGTGTVTVTGPSSKWIVGGSLQVGGFDIGLSNMTIGDLEGDDTLYGDQVGIGTLYVNDGGLVSIRNAIGVDPMNTSTDLLFAIGRKGTVWLDGGTINIGSATGTDQQGQARSDTVQVLNDGVIKGTGRIDTGVFHNRYFGRVSVSAGQSLVIDASSQFATGPAQTPPEPLLNFGLIEVLGTADSRAELDFERAPSVTNPVRPLINRPVFLPPNPTKFIGGMISAQWATLRSATGIQNEGIMAFTAGSNVIQAHVNQVVGPTGFVPVFSIGPNTSVVVEDDCLGCAPTFVGGGNTLQILDPGTFTSAGTITLQLSLSNPNLISAAGDIGISGVINLSLASDVLADLSANGPGQSFGFITFTGGAYQTTLDANGVPLPDYTKPLPDCSGVPSCVVPGLGVSGPNLAALLGPTFNNIVPVAQRIGESIVISFLNPTAGGAMAPDFNNDGVVDGLDFAIWQANVGITAGATLLQGDADGDGDVDGDDFLFWQRNVGKPAPWNGAGAGSGSSSSSLGAVPEPAGLAMLLCGGSLALALHRRRHDR